MAATKGPEPERIFHLFVEGYAEVWLSELASEQDPVDYIKDKLGDINFDGQVRLVRET